MKKLFIGTMKAVCGLFVFSFGIYLVINADIGLDPWSALNVGVASVSGMSYGDVSIIVSLVILAADWLLKEKIGIATLLDALIVGKFVDFFIWLGLFEKCSDFLTGIMVLLLGQVFLSVGSYFYMGAGLGCGPRDALMVAVGKRLRKFPIGLARGLLEGAVLFMGWSLGAKVGLGTIIYVVGIGFVLQITFKALRFDATAVRHVDAVYSMKMIRNSVCPEKE